MSQFQGVFHSLLRFIRIRLVLHLLDAHAQTAILSEGHVLLLHVLLATLRELIGPGVDLVGDEGAYGRDDEEDEERDQVARLGHGWGCSVSGRVEVGCVIEEETGYVVYLGCLVSGGGFIRRCRRGLYRGFE